MNYNYLKYFKVLAETEHYTHASEKLNISQPSLSHAMSELENELGVILFEKQGRNIRLTKYGKFYYEYIEKGLTEIQHGNIFVRSLASIDSGTIDLGFIYTLGAYYIPNVIKKFLKNNPGVHFNLFQNTSATVIKNLRDQIFDVGFCSKVENTNDINYIPVVKEEIVLVVSKKHPLARFDSIDLTKIKPSEKWIMYSKRSGLRPYLDEVFKSVKITPNIQCEIVEDTAALGLVAINYGIALVPDINIIRLYDLKTIKIENKLEDRNIYMATLKNRYMTPSVNKFINFMIHNTFNNQEFENE